MSQVNVDVIKKAFIGLKGSTFQTFDQTPGAVKIIMEKNGRKKNLDFPSLFKEAGATVVAPYSAVTSLPTATKKPKKKEATDVDSLTDTGTKVKTEEVPVDLLPTNLEFNIVDIFDKQLVDVRFYEPSATTHRLTICMDFLANDVVADPELAKKTRPVLMVLTFNLPNRRRK